CLKRGVGILQAAAELNAVATLTHRENPDMAKDVGSAPLLLELVRGIPNPVGRRQAMPVMILLMAVGALVLLIACMNVGNLQVARGMGRQREIAVRFALGAGRARVLRQLMTENLELGLLSGPERPRSSSIVMTDAKPISRADSASEYWRRLLSVCSMTCPMLD